MDFILYEYIIKSLKIIFHDTQFKLLVAKKRLTPFQSLVLVFCRAHE